MEAELSAVPLNMLGCRDYCPEVLDVRTVWIVRSPCEPGCGSRESAGGAMGPSLFGSELRRAREAMGMTREQFAEAVNYSVSLVEKIELGRKFPSQEFADKSDEVLKLDGLLGRIREHTLKEAATPTWAQPWFDLLQQATMLRAYHPQVIHGLVQTEAYARAHLRSDDPEQTESRVRARMERQRELLAQEKPLKLVVLLDESVLRRNLGGKDVMREQLQHLIDFPATVQVIPAGSELSIGLDGAFEIATMDDGRELGYAETPLEGLLSAKPEVVSQARDRFEALRAEALPRRQSIELIQKVMEEWT